MFRSLLQKIIYILNCIPCFLIDGKYTLHGAHEYIPPAATTLRTLPKNIDVRLVYCGLEIWSEWCSQTRIYVELEGDLQTVGYIDHLTIKMYLSVAYLETPHIRKSLNIVNGTVSFENLLQEFTYLFVRPH